MPFFLVKPLSALVKYTRYAFHRHENGFKNSGGLPLPSKGQSWDRMPDVAGSC